MTKIAYIVQGKFHPKEMEKRQKFLSSLIDKGNDIKLIPGELKLSAIQSSFESALSVPALIKVAMKAEKEGYNAIIIGCSGNPGLEAIREAVSIPVVGPGISTNMLAGLVGRKYVNIGPLDAGMTTLEAREDRKKLVSGLVKAGRKAIDENGADVIALSCMSTGFQNVDVEMHEQLGVPVINNVKAAVKMAELMVDLNIPHSKKSFKTPIHSPLWPEF